MKKDPYKFTVRFNPNDPRQRQAAELLNQYPQRGKAILIAKALLGATGRGGTPIDPKEGEPQNADIEDSVEIDEAAMDAINSAMELFSGQQHTN